MKVKSARLVNQLRYHSFYRDGVEDNTVTHLSLNPVGWLHIDFVSGDHKGTRLGIPPNGIGHVEYYPDAPDEKQQQKR